MRIFELLKIGTDSHYEKSIAQAAAKVKSFLITYGCEFPGVKKGLSGGGRCWGDFSVISFNTAHLIYTAHLKLTSDS